MSSVENDVTVEAYTEEANFVPIENVAQYFSVSAATVRVWVRDDVIPKDCYIKIGRTYRFRLDAITKAFLKANEKAHGQDQEQIDAEEPSTLNLDFNDATTNEENEEY